MEKSLQSGRKDTINIRYDQAAENKKVEEKKRRKHNVNFLSNWII